MFPQVTAAVAKVLRQLPGWRVECRGEIHVKGKGTMVTSFVEPLPPSAVEEVHITDETHNSETRKSIGCIVANKFSGLISKRNSDSSGRKQRTDLARKLISDLALKKNIDLGRSRSSVV